MLGRIEALLDEGQEALRAGEWSSARSSFEAVLEREESPAALFGLGTALWWVGETEPSIRCWERAYAASRRLREPAQAVQAAVYLCLGYQMSLGNEAAARGWLARAASLVQELDLDPFAGWVLYCRAYLATDGGRPQTAERWAREALVLARRFGDTDLELCATSELGAALVQSGKLDEGVPLLEQAMAGALAGEGSDLETVAVISCRVITWCSRAAEFTRALQWIRAADGLNRRYDGSHLFTTCRTHYGAILTATGAWDQADEELRAALRVDGRAEPALHAEALARLAELRLAQGRVDDAARVLAGYEGHPATAFASAAIHLTRGAPAVAMSIIRRRLRELDEGCLEGAVLVGLLAEAEIVGGAPDRAATRARRLVERGSSASCELIAARGERALGHALLASGDPRGAIEHLEISLAAFGRLTMPLEGARTRFLLARALAESEPATAVAEARTALAAFEELGAARDADELAAFLRSLGVKAARAGPKGIGLLSRREREVLVLLGEGLSNPEIAGRLFISRKTVEHHVASVLAKLGMRGRSEAAAFAARHLEHDHATE